MRASVPASAPSTARITGSEARGVPASEEPAGTPFFESNASPTGLSTELPTDFGRSTGIQDWNKNPAQLLFLCASKPERELKHGTPATSVAGVYSFMGCVREPPAPLPPAPAAWTDRAADICFR